MTLWNKFQNNFDKIIEDIDEYKKILNFCINYENNILIYSSIGFPMDLLIDEIIKRKFKISHIYRKEYFLTLCREGGGMDTDNGQTGAIEPRGLRFPAYWYKYAIFWTLLVCNCQS